jgi:hypothetical protein
MCRHDIHQRTIHKHTHPTKQTVFPWLGGMVGSVLFFALLIAPLLNFHPLTQTKNHFFLVLQSWLNHFVAFFFLIFLLLFVCSFSFHPLCGFSLANTNILTVSTTVFPHHFFQFFSLHCINQIKSNRLFLFCFQNQAISFLLTTYITLNTTKYRHSTCLFVPLTQPPMSFCIIFSSSSCTSGGARLRCAISRGISPLVVLATTVSGADATSSSTTS